VFGIYIKPTIRTFTPFNAKEDYTVYFNASGTDQFSSVNYVIENNSDGSEIVNITIAMYQAKFIIPVYLLNLR